MGIRFVAAAAAFGAAVAALCLAVVAPVVFATDSADGYMPSLWILRGETLERHSARDGSVIKVFAAREAAAFGVDRKSGRVWVFGEHRLRIHGPDGALQAQIPVSLPGVGHARRDRERGETADERGERDEGEDDAVRSSPAPVVDDAAGFAWVVFGSALLRIDAVGDAAEVPGLRGRPLGLALDRGSARLWILRRGGLTALERDGGGRRGFAFARGARPRGLVFDGRRGRLWVLFRGRLRAYGRDGGAVLEVALPKGLDRRAAADGAGGVWIAGARRLAHVDESGRMAFVLRPFAGEEGGGAIVGLAANPEDGSAWVAGRRRLHRFAADSRLLARTRIGGRGAAHARGYGEDERRERSGRPLQLVVYADVDPPSVRLTAPIDDAVVATGRPRVELKFADDGSGVDIARTVLSVDGRPLPARCRADSAARTHCTLNARLPEGPVTLQAMVTDAAGNTSPPARVRFRVDTVPPAVTVDAPAAGAFLNRSPAAVRGTLSERASLVLNGSPVEVGPDLHFVAAAKLAEGPNTLALAAVDAAGNRGGRVIRVTLDTLPPAPLRGDRVVVSAPAADGKVEVRGGAGSVEAGVRVTAVDVRSGRRVQTVADAMGGFSLRIEARPGDTVRLVLTDAAGNAAAPHELAVGNRAPVLAPVGDRTVAPGATLRIALRATDPDGDAVRYGALPLPLPEGATLDAAEGVFTFRPDGRTSGLLELEFYATDGMAVSRRAVRIDVSAPDPGTAAAVSGIVLDANAAAVGRTRPIVGLTVTIAGSGLAARTDARGRFALSGLPAGPQVLAFDAATARPAPGGGSYAGFRRRIDVVAHTVRQLARPVYLPRIETASRTPVDPGARTVVSNARLGVTLTVAAGSAVGPDGAPFTGMLSISEVPRGFAPATLPEGVEPGLLVTLQPVGVRFTTPAKLAFPNLDHLAPGNEVDLWSVDPDRGVFAVVGTGRVSADGARLETVAGGVRATDWHALLPPAGQGNGETDESQSPDRCPCRQDGSPAGSRVLSKSGALLTSVALPSYTVFGRTMRPTLVYDSARADPRPLLPFDLTVPLRAAVPPRLSYRLSVGGVRGAREVFVATTGLREDIDETLRGVADVPAGALRTGLYPYRIALTSYYDRTRIGSDLRGTVAVVNGRRSPFGAGWGLGGLERLHPAPAGDVLLSAGNGERLEFSAAADGTLRAPPGDRSVLTQAPGGGYTRTLKDGARIDYDARGRMTRRTDRNGNATTYRYDAQDRPVVIVGPAGRETRLRYASGRLAALTDPAGRTTTFVHDAAGDLVGVTLPDGARLRFTYDTRHRLLTETDARGSVTRHHYDALGRLIRVTAPDGAVRLATTNQATGWVDPARGSGTTGAPASVVRPPPLLQAGFVDGEGRTRRVDLDRLGLLTRISDFAGLVTTIERDAAGDPLRIRRPTGERRFTYDARGNLLSRFDSSLGGMRSFEYEPVHNRITRIVDALGNATALRYDGRGNLVEVTTPERRTLRMSYDARGLRTGLVDALGTPTRFTYDGDGNLTGVIEGDGPGRRVTSLEYTAAGDLAAVTDAAGRRLRFAYDAAGRVLAQTLPDGRQIRYGYDPKGNLVSLTPPGRSAHRFAHTPLDRTAVYTPPDVGRGDPATRFRYNLAGQLTRILRPDGRAVDLAYDGGGRLARVEVARGRYEYRYDAKDFRGRPTGQLNRVVAPGGNALDYLYIGERLTGYVWSGAIRGHVTWVYDRAGRIRSRRVNDEPAYFAYDRDGLLVQAGQLLVHRDPAGGRIADTELGLVRTARTYNRFGELVGQKGAGARGDAITAEVDVGIASAGPLRVRGTLAGAGAARIGATRIPVAADGSLSGEVPLSAGDNRLVIEVLTPAGTVIRSLERRVLAQPSTATGVRVVALRAVAADGAAYFEDDTGLLQRVAPGGGRPQRLSWLDGASAVAPAAGGVVYIVKGGRLWRHDGAGDRPLADLAGLSPGLRPAIAAVSGRGVYLAADHFIHRIDPAGAVTPFATLPATDTDLRIAASTWGVVVGSRTTGNVYRVGTDGSHTLIERQPDFVDLAVDSTGRLCYLRPSATPPIGGAGLGARVLAALVRPAAAATPPLLFPVIGCHLPGAPLRTLTLDRIPNSLAIDAADRIYYGRGDNIVRIKGGRLVPLIAGRPVFATLTLSGTVHSVGFRQAFQRDAVGRITRRTESLGARTTVSEYTYDPAGRLAEVTVDGAVAEHYAYDANGNRIAAVTAAGTVTGTYDAQDRMLTYGGATFAYNANGDLEARREGGKTTGYHYDEFGNLLAVDLPDGRRLEYLVDGENRRIGKRVDGSLVQGFLYRDGLNPVAELDASGTVVARFVYGTRPNVPDYMEKGGLTYRILSDPLGSPRLVVDIATAVVVQELEYDSFGNVTRDTNPGFQPFGFAGGLYDRDTGLVRFGARDYDPRTGRWTTKDPVGFFGDSANLYDYGLGNPVNFNDPSGEFVPLLVLIPAVGGLISGAFEAFNESRKCNAGLSDLLKGFGRGFVAGVLGTLSGIGAGVATGNPFVGGAVGGAAGSAANQVLASEDFSFSGLVGGAALGAVTGPFASRVLPTKGRLPSLLTPRTTRNFGRNSARLLGQEALSSGIGGGIGAGAAGFGSRACGCN